MLTGVGIGLTAIFGHPRQVQIDWLLPLSGVQLEIDSSRRVLHGADGAVGIPVGLYSIGYARREHLGPLPLAVLPMFVACDAPGARRRIGDDLPVGMGTDGRWPR